MSTSKPVCTSAEAPPQSTACSPKRSVSVSSVKVVLIAPARVPPIALAYDRASASALPVASCSTATRQGTPLPSTYWRRTRWPGPFGATIATSTSAGGLIRPYRMLRPWPKKSALPAVRFGAIDSA